MSGSPVLPYGGEDNPNSGYSAGVNTSQERAEGEDRDGTTARRQQSVLRLLDHQGSYGATWRDVAGAYGYHHGQASSALSGLHKAGKIARLTERRDRCHVYVLPEHVGGRETQEQGRNRQLRYTRDDMAEAWATGYDAGWQDSDEDTSIGNINPYQGEVTS